MSSGRMPGGWDARRAVQTIVVDPGGAKWLGSGYLVTADLVLTAEHVLHGARTAVMRFVEGAGRVRQVTANVVFADARADVAVLRLEQAEAGKVRGPVFGRLAGPVDCDVLGFPRFQLNNDHRAADVPRDGLYRDFHPATGICHPEANRYAGTLKVMVSARPGLDPDGVSPWEGMSGAAVFVGEVLVAVLTEHHPRQGLGMLTASRVDGWYRLLDSRALADLAGLIRLPATDDRLTMVGDGIAPQTTTAGASMSLPRDVATYTGRTSDLEQLVAALEVAEQAGAGAVLAVHAVDGMAGVGKTTFALHVAHALAGRFPDGQRFVALHAHTPGVAPADPNQVLADLLSADNVPADQIPDAIAARADAWRARTAGRRMLLILDDAVDSAQVRPLIPSAPGTLVLVTSRRRLSGLADAVPIGLDVLDADEAAALFVRIAGRPQLGAEDAEVLRLIGLCGHLPLAIGLAAARLRHHRSWSPADLIAELTSAAGRLPVLAAEDQSVAAAFALSYRNLNPGQQRLFRALGTCPSVDIEAGAAAALLEVDPEHAGRVLFELEGHRLLDETVRGRYRMHDLLREHARTRAHTDPDQTRDAINRLLTHYRTTATTYREQSREARLAFLRTERANLLACLDYARDHNLTRHLIALTAIVAPVLNTDGPWPLAVTLHAQAATTAERVHDVPGQAGALDSLGRVRYMTDDYPGAVRAHQQALELFQQLGDRLGQAGALDSLGRVQYLTGDYPGAVRYYQQALELFQQLGDRLGQAAVLNNLGDVRYLTGDYPGAVRAHQQALKLFQQLGDRLGQATALDSLGDVRRETDDYPGAVRAHQQALELFRKLGDRLGQAGALDSLGRVRYLTGDYPDAVRYYQQALELFQQLGYRLGQADALDGMGECRHREGLGGQAATLFRQALAIYQELGTPRAEEIAARLAELDFESTDSPN